MRNARKLLRGKSDTRDTLATGVAPLLCVDLGHTVVQVPVAQVLAPVNEAGADDELAVGCVPRMRFRQLQLQLRRGALRQANSVLGLSVQGKDGIRVDIHLPTQLNITAVVQLLLEMVLTMPELLAVCAGKRLGSAELIDSLRLQLFHIGEGHELGGSAAAAKQAHCEFDSECPRHLCKCNQRTLALTCTVIFKGCGQYANVCKLATA
mmetsp:Transcript_168525/g.541627  ORF Transcript_168525/g.541627 Transcript_168525/m.541627 type:complete len:208 (+) Transcript_168525:796-1419(+)